jgi:apolipoprotein N-acyltransferase
MTYLQTESDKKDEQLLRKIVDGRTHGLEAVKVLNSVFTNLVLWSREDLETQLTHVYKFNPLEIDNLLALHPSLVTLPENIFPLDLENLPEEKQADPYGKIMVFQKDNGWILIEPSEVEDFTNLYQCTHWTYTPDLPPQP